MLLARIFGITMNTDDHGSLSQIQSQMLVSSLERYDGELMEKSQLLCGPSTQSSVLRILEFALYRLSNNLLSETAIDELSRWLIRQQQNGLLASFLKTEMPTVHACATKILESVLRIGDANFLELLIDSGIDISPLKGVYGGRHLLYATNQGNSQIVQILLKNGADVNTLPTEPPWLTTLQYATSRGDAHIVQVLLKAGANVDAVSISPWYDTALSIAVGDGRKVELVRILLAAGANIDNCTIGNKPAIEYSALFCHHDELHQILLSASSKDYGSTTFHGVLEAASTGIQALSKYLSKNGKTGALLQEILEEALKFACEHSNHSAVMSLLDMGVDPNCLLPSNIGCPLQNAVSQGDFELVKMLIKAGASVKTPGILCSAIEHDEKMCQGSKMLQFMLEEGADIKTYGKRALSRAAYGGNFEAFQILLFSGVDVDDDYSFNTQTVLQNAVRSQNIGTVKIILDAGADVNALSEDGVDTAVGIAVEVATDSYQSVEMVQVLLAAGADVNIPESILQAPIHRGDERLVSILVKEGADVNSPTTRGDSISPVQAAAMKGNLSLIKLLLESGANINAPAGKVNGRTAIQAASSTESPKMELIQFLLDAGANINAPAGEFNGRTAIQAASSTESPKIELIQFLLDAGANINAPAGEFGGRTSIQAASSTESPTVELIKFLLDAGANINAPACEWFGRTAIQAASFKESPTMELIDFLLDAGAEINAPAGAFAGVTALQGAAIRGHMKIALRFLEAGAGVNALAAAESGRTALDGAAGLGRLDMVQMLLNAGAYGDSKKLHRFGNAIELARDNGHFTIASLLERA